MKILLKGINILFIITLITITAAVSYIALPQFGNQALIVRSGSMMPTIDVGSIVVVRSTGSGVLSPLSSSTGLYNPGDIIAFRSEKNSDTIITHRVTEVLTEREGVAYKTKGDANKSPDGWTVASENVLGKSYFVIPSAGKILAFAKSDMGFPVLIIAPAVFVMLLEAFNIFREVRKRKKALTAQNLQEPASSTPVPSWSDLITEQVQESSPFVLIKKSLFGNTQRYNITGLKILMPFLLFGLVFPNTFAMYADTEVSTDNIFQASADFSEEEDPDPELEVSPGDVVINEIMWMGTQGDAADEWIELRNMTSDTIDLSNWVVENLGQGVTNDIVIPGGSSIPPNGFFMIANDTRADGNHDVDPDVVTNINLQNPGEQLILRTSAGGTIIDTANGVGAWHAGDDPGGQNPEVSMERNDPPSDGTIAGSWHDATSATNMDAGEREIATPKATNSTP